jgi:acetyl esterase/lipase
VSGPAAIVYLHGGGFAIGSATSHRGICSRLAVRTGRPVALVSYRLAPEHPFPAAVQDTAAVLAAVLGSGSAFDPARVVVVGDSAGAGLAVAAVVHERDAGHPLPAALVAMSGWYDLTLTNASLGRFDTTDPILHRALLAEWAGWYLGGTPVSDPSASVAFASLGGFPPLLLLVAAEEVLRDDTLRLAEQAEAAGVDVTVVVQPDVVHHWPVLAGLFPEADATVADIASWIADRT